MGRPKLSLVIDDVVYDSLKIAFTSLGVSKTFLQKRIKKYGTILSAEQVKCIKPRRPVVINGIHYNCERDAERALGLGRGMISYNIAHGRALDCRDPIKRGQVITIDGVCYKSLRKAAKALHADKGVISQTIKRLGTNILKRSDIPQQKKVSIEINGVRYNSVYSAAKTLGMKPHLLYNRLFNGYNGNLFDPITTKEDRVKMFGKPIEVGGIKFDSIYQAARYFNIRHDTFRWRLKMGWDTDEAAYKVPIINNGITKQQLIKEVMFK